VLLPFDDLGAVIPEIWERWLSRDPVEMVQQPQYADCAALTAGGVDRRGPAGRVLPRPGRHRVPSGRREGRVCPDERVHFELFEGTHGGIEYRYPLAVRWLCEQMR
jgi:hypothetical protein